MSKKQEEVKTVEIKRVGQCKTLQELGIFLSKSDTAAGRFDLLLMKGGKLSKLLRRFEEVRGDSKDFLSKSKLRAHIKHRSDVNGWQFQIKDADSDDPYVRLKKIA